MPEIKRIEPGRRFSEAVVCDGVVYISGQVDLARNRDPKVQTAEVLKTIDALLAKAGSDKEHILRCTVYLSNMGYFSEMNQAWEEWVSKTNPPGPIRPRVCTSRSVLESTDFNSRSCSGLTRRNLDKSDRFGKITHPFVEGGFCIRTAFFCLVVKEWKNLLRLLIWLMSVVSLSLFTRVRNFSQASP